MDAYALAATTRAPAHDLRADANLPQWHTGRKAGTIVGGHVWRATYQWNPATERTELIAQVDTVGSENLTGVAGA